MKPGAAWGASVAAVITYASAVLAHVPPVLYYYPRLGRWGFDVVAGEPGTRWYGWMIYAVLGGLVGMLAGRFIRNRPPWAWVGWLAAIAWVVLAWHERQWF